MTMPMPAESRYGTLVRSRMVTGGGALRNSSCSSNIVRMVMGPLRVKIATSALLPCRRSKERVSSVGMLEQCNKQWQMECYRYVNQRTAKQNRGPDSRPIPDPFEAVNREVSAANSITASAVRQAGWRRRDNS